MSLRPASLIGDLLIAITADDAGEDCNRRNPVREIVMAATLGRKTAPALAIHSSDFAASPWSDVWLGRMVNRRFTMFAVLFGLRIPKGPTHMAFRANQQLRDDIWDYRSKSPAGEDENILSFAPSVTKDYGTTALNLVHQAAEIFKGMENQARETEAHAQSMCESFAEKLRLAEKQRDSAERARREVVNELNGKLQDISKALQQAHSRITIMEEQAIAAEFRAQAVEAKLYQANQELGAIEEAIRKRLL